ncbi:hypothetical protein FPQ18DRAFT_382903 [Pyronema domesticum]|uniref:Uncharacterized protein n=1 Tax=Pyronema omphalodes (strain CBS 100304) TaxID=1076935 RepID=U4LPY3_PYROM|nr:hypothetical protein FPQ18DRAFT_382903 [Pyronema domesticum]CCX31380.1 Similar to hypothetical protein [Tuber melanosporum Mel28]; acc. no. XP_002835668 [Pyronema omphalodes CBS 100304]
MPIKFPKFTRRKSVGNALEAKYEPASQTNNDDHHDTPTSKDSPSSGSGFRVLPRNRGSAQTPAVSTNAGSEYYAVSQNRLSSHSTLPSADTPQTPDDYRPVDPYHFAGGKGQNFGPQRQSVGSTLSPPYTRGSISGPVNVPKLETDLDTSSLFGDDMFDFSKSKKDNKDSRVTPTAPKLAQSAIINTGDNHYNIPPVPPASTPRAYNNIFASSQHMDSDRPNNNNESSPYHWDSNTSADQPTGVNASRNPRNLTPGQKPSPPFKHTRTDSLEAPSRGIQKRGTGDTTASLKRASVAIRGPSPSSIQDDDAAIVANSARRSRGSSPTRRPSDTSKDGDSGWEERAPTPSDQGANKTANKPAPTTGTGRQLIDAVEPVEDLDLSFSAALAARYESTEHQAQQKPTGRVLTRAQFEKMQQQQDDQRRLSGKPAEDDESDESDYEEETEAEKVKEMAKQRARQEAHLSVYRQQMMKISGTDPSDVPLLGMNTRQSMSTSALPLALNNMDPGSSGKNSDEEDEEIPLGILLAHGFPAKNRPPTRLSTASSQPNLRAAAQQQSGPLPPFARNLPQDPYNLGASIINPMNRMSLAYGGGTGPRSVTGGSVYGGESPQPRGPQGLVGEIMRAEEQKAARKAMGGHAVARFNQPVQHDPFKQDPFNRPVSRGGGGLLGTMGGGGMNGNMGMGMGGSMGMQGMGMNGGMMGMGGMGMDPVQAQMQMQQQYMQMQMQMMQMQMMQGQQSPLMPPTGMMGQQQRPSSMMTMNQPMTGLQVPPLPGQRAMSMVESQFTQLPPIPNTMRSSYAPSVAASQRRGSAVGGALNNFLGPSGYTPSIAPSERSTVGQPSRYRPVSYQPPVNGAGNRASSLTSRSGQDWNKKTPGPSNLKKSTADSDEEDDEWAELQKKREGLKKKKESGGFKGMLGFSSATATA